MDPQRELASYNHERLQLHGPDGSWREELEQELRHRIREVALVEALREQVADRAAEAPTDPDAFVAWFEDLERTGPGQGDPLFPWLAEQASREQLRWFVRQEVAGEAGFGDLVAMTQVGVPRRMKLEMARNYWDEMGRGVRRAMHDPLLGALAEYLDVEGLDVDPLPEALAVGNVMVALAFERFYGYHSIGCLGVVELTAPGRAEQVARGLKRVGVPTRARKYYALHAKIDLLHAEHWNENVLRPAIACEPRAASWIAEGALIRLLAGARSFEAYRRELGPGSLSGIASPPRC